MGLLYDSKGNRLPQDSTSLKEQAAAARKAKQQEKNDRIIASTKSLPWQTREFTERKCRESELYCSEPLEAPEQIDPTKLSNYPLPANHPKAQDNYTGIFLAVVIAFWIAAFMVWVASAPNSPAHPDDDRQAFDSAPMPG